MAGRRNGYQRDLRAVAGHLLEAAFSGESLSGVPIDLFYLSGQRRVHTIHFRPLLVDGCLAIDGNGFNIHINAAESAKFELAEIALDELTSPPTLGVRQRFTFAHELAHTLLYDLVGDRPTLNPRRVQMVVEIVGDNREASVEAFCQIAAGLILIPVKVIGAIRERFELRVGQMAAFLKTMARSWDVSIEVAMHRLAGDDVFERLFTQGTRGLIFVRDGRVRACVWGEALVPFLRRPGLYSRIDSWARPLGILTGRYASAGGPTKMWQRGPLYIIRTENHGRLDSYCLEVVAGLG